MPKMWRAYGQKLYCRLGLHKVWTYRRAIRRQPMTKMPEPSMIWVSKGEDFNKTWDELIKQPLDAIYIVRRQTERKE